MTASISSFFVYGEIYDCFIRVDNEDGRYYFKPLSVPLSETTDEKLENWKQVAIDEATSYWNSL